MSSRTVVLATRLDAPADTVHTDVVDVDAGPFTAVVALGSAGLCRCRRRRWRSLAGRHLPA